MKTANISNAPQLLKLAATTPEEVAMMSRYVQDAIVVQSFMMHYQEDQCFRMLINRYCWEKQHHTELSNEEREKPARIHSVLAFSNIKKAQHQGFNLEDGGRIHALLALQAHPDNNLELVFSGGQRMLLTCDKILCHLRDIGEPWECGAQPDHDDV